MCMMNNEWWDSGLGGAKLFWPGHTVWEFRWSKLSSTASPIFSKTDQLGFLTSVCLPKWILFLEPHWVGIYMVTIKPHKNGSRQDEVTLRFTLD